jgi:hypothetical protein
LRQAALLAVLAGTLGVSAPAQSRRVPRAASAPPNYAVYHDPRLGSDLYYLANFHPVPDTEHTGFTRFESPDGSIQVGVGIKIGPANFADEYNAVVQATHGKITDSRIFQGRFPAPLG